ncbi:helix-turn-helix domain-containing protein [Novispirillum itersonii]|uniref:helix-turn-helix domain-containing protein n=1 Tax=Novispirillum itersonii TaxID=189 RepID=UPI00161ACBDA
MTDSLKIRLRRIRHQAGLSASEMARHVGLKDRKSWENYERGQTTPKADVLTRLAQLGIDINWLLTGTMADSQTENPSPPAAGPYPSPESGPAGPHWGRNYSSASGRAAGRHPRTGRPPTGAGLCGSGLNLRYGSGARRRAAADPATDPPAAAQPPA